ncbi:hypothetical protein HDU80_004545 [Chytriomyces hyalinus]|nr:hypothetical protein HDU80_004545 [Chytriomyces hyalinus]
MDPQTQTRVWPSSSGKEASRSVFIRRSKSVKWLAGLLLVWALTVVLLNHTMKDGRSPHGLKAAKITHDDDAELESGIGRRTDERWPEYAFIVKTGSEVLVTRGASQLLSFLQGAKNLVFIGEEAGHTLAEYEMQDVVTGSYERALKAVEGWHQPPSRLSKRGASLLDSKPDKTTNGYKSQAHKNIPGIRRAYELFPDVEWFILLDDDSYLFMDNMDDFLSEYNSSLPYYIGAANKFTGCGFKTFDEAPKFAHGSAIIMSKEAVRRIQPFIDLCIVKLHGCFAGDVRTSICMKEAGIFLTRAPVEAFSKFAPNHEFNWPPNPCTKPIVFHHLLPEQIQTFYQLQKHPVNKTRGLTLGEVYSTFYAGMHRLDNMDRSGQDLQVFPNISSESACRKHCQHNLKCVSWTLKKPMNATDVGHCHIKSRIFEAKPMNGSVSEVLKERYECK